MKRVGNKRMKIMSFLLIGSLAILTGCVDKESSRDANSSNSNHIEVTVKNGSYVYFDGGKESNDNDKGNLALEIIIKNTGKSKLEISPSDIGLYDKDGSKIEDQKIYTDDDEFVKLPQTKLSSGKSTKGYLIFPVIKKEKYDLIFESDENKEDQVKVSIDTSQYADNSNDIKNLVSAYVDSVFLNKALDNNGSKLRLYNNDKEEREEFRQEYMDEFKRSFEYYEPSAAEIATVVDTYIAANQKNASIDYAINELTPNQASVFIKPSTIQLLNVNDKEIRTKFIEENQGKYGLDVNAAAADAEKYLMQEIPKKYKETEATLPLQMKKEGYKVLLIKKGKKWQINTEDHEANGDYNEIKKAFMGNSDVKPQ